MTAMKNILSVVILFVLIHIASPTQVFAVNTPAFSTCSAPTGEVIANYSEGIHGIVGETAEHKGSDVVYKMNEWQVLQCFCPKDAGQGIETVWWKYASLSDTDINTLQKEGWIFIPNGKLWGLDNAQYLAKNTRFECRGIGGGNGQILGITEFAATGSSNNLFFAGIIASVGIAFLFLSKRETK